MYTKKGKSPPFFFTQPSQTKPQNHWGKGCEVEAEKLLVFSQQFFGIFLTLFSSSPAGSYPALHHPWETLHFKVIFPLFGGLFFNPLTLTPVPVSFGGSRQDPAPVRQSDARHAKSFPKLSVFLLF